MKTLTALFFTLLLSTLSISQDWIPMDRGIAPNSDDGVTDLKIDPSNNTLFASGVFFKSFLGDTLWGIAKWDSHLSKWENLSSTGSPYARDISFYLGHLVSFAGHTQESRDDLQVFHTWIDDSWSYDPMGPNQSVFGSRIIDGELYIVGGFTTVAGVETFGIAIYDGKTFKPFFGKFSQNFHVIEDVIKFNDEIYITGQTLSGFPDYPWTGLAVLGDDQLNVAHTQFTGNFFQMWPHCLEVFQDELYIGGLLHEDQGFSGNGLVRFNGNDMRDVSGGVNASITDMKVYENELYVVGSFTRIGANVKWNSSQYGEECFGVAKWDGRKWTCLNTEPVNIGIIKCLEIFRDTLYVGGNFHNIGGNENLSLVARKKINPNRSISNLGQINLFPNPTTGQINFEFLQSLTTIADIEIFNSLGQSIHSSIFLPWSKHYSIDFNYPAGAYFVTVTVGAEGITKKLIKLGAE